MSSRKLPRVQIDYLPCNPEKGIGVIMRKGNYWSEIKHYTDKDELHALREEMINFLGKKPAKREIKMTGFEQDFVDDFMRYLGYKV